MSIKIDCHDLPNNDLDMKTVRTILDSGASLNDRTVLLKSVAAEAHAIDQIKLRDLPPRSYEKIIYGMYLVIEVNAKYLLEEQCRPANVRKSDQRTSVLARPNVQKTQSHRRIILIHPGYPEDKDKTSLEDEKSPDVEDSPEDTAGPSRPFHPKPFAEVDLKDSEKLLDRLVLLPHTKSIDLADGLFEQLLNIWEKSPKVQDMNQYLEERGYYKQADDAAIPQGPIPMFEDEE